MEIPFRPLNTLAPISSCPSTLSQELSAVSYTSFFKTVASFIANFHVTEMFLLSSIQFEFLISISLSSFFLSH